MSIRDRRRQEAAAAAKAKEKETLAARAAQLKLAKIVLAKVSQAKASLDALAGNAAWGSVPDMIRGPAESTLATLVAAESAASAVIKSDGVGTLPITDAKASHCAHISGAAQCFGNRGGSKVGPMRSPKHSLRPLPPSHRKALSAIIGEAKKTSVLAGQVLKTLSKA